MPHRVQELCDQFSDLIIEASNPQQEFTRIDSAVSFSNQSLIFVADEAHLNTLEKDTPAVVITSPNLADKIADSVPCIVTANNVRLAQALIKQRLDDYDSSDSEWEAVHPSAVVHESVSFGDNVRIGPNSVIGKNVVIGDNTQVRANCVIEHDTVIGNDCIINNLVNVGYGSKLGDRVILRTGVVIGGEGFGLAQDSDRRYHRLPHTGNVEIHDDVQIGANCNIDRGTYGSTVIARGVKMDALCHIAHNVMIGEDTLFVAQVGIAGSTKIGNRVILSGHAAVLDHLNIADDVVLVHRAGVTEDITSAGMWAGTPAKPFKEYVRGLNVDKKLARLEKKIKELG